MHEIAHLIGILEQLPRHLEQPQQLVQRIGGGLLPLQGRLLLQLLRHQAKQL